MGAWSHTSFGNDDAADFLYEVEEQGHAAIEGAIARIEIIGRDGYVDAPDASMALAAAELLAAANGKPPVDFPQEAQQVIPAVKSDAQLRIRASGVAARILANSELKDLWEEGGELSPWHAEVQGLIERLK